MTTQPEARQRLAALMDERRLDLRLTWQEVAERGSVSLRALANARTGDSEIRPLTQRGIEAGLHWTPGSVAEILAGSAPTPREALGARTGIPVIDQASEAEQVAPYMRQVQDEIDRARRQYGDPDGEQIFGPGQEANTWDRGDFSEDVKIALLATFRLFAFKARSSESGDTRAGLRVLPGGA